MFWRFWCKHDEVKCISNIHGDLINLLSDDRTVRSVWKCKKCGKMIYLPYLNPDCNVVNFEVPKSPTMKSIPLPDWYKKHEKSPEEWKLIPYTEKEIAINFISAYMHSTAEDKEHLLFEVVNYLESGGSFDSSFISKKLTYLKITTPGFPD